MRDMNIELSRCLPDARRVVIPGATHAVQYDAPEELAARTAGFLTLTRPASAVGARCYYPAMAVSIQVLMSPGCGHGSQTLDLIRDVVTQTVPDASLETVTVATIEDAERLAFPGSPTVRVDGTDIDPSPPRGAALG